MLKYPLPSLIWSPDALLTKSLSEDQFCHSKQCRSYLMQHNAAFHLGLNVSLVQKGLSHPTILCFGKKTGQSFFEQTFSCIMDNNICQYIWDRNSYLNQICCPSVVFYHVMSYLNVYRNFSLF